MPERNDYKTETLEEAGGEVAGLKSAAIKIVGSYAYGHLRLESGIHRLVRNPRLILIIVVILLLPVYLFFRLWMKPLRGNQSRRIAY